MSIEVSRVKKEPIYDNQSTSETRKTVSNDSNPNLEESNKIETQKSKSHIEIKVEEEEEEKFSATEEFTKKNISIETVSIAFLKETETTTKSKRDKQHKSK